MLSFSCTFTFKKFTKFVISLASFGLFIFPILFQTLLPALFFKRIKMLVVNLLDSKPTLAQLVFTNFQGWIFALNFFLHFSPKAIRLFITTLRIHQTHFINQNILQRWSRHFINKTNKNDIIELLVFDVKNF